VSQMTVGLAASSDIPSWLEIVHEVEPLFGALPGFEATLAKNIDRGRAVVVRERDGSVLAGALLGAGEGHGVVAWLAVRASAQGRGVGGVLLADVLGRFPAGEDVVVDTFGDDPPGGAAARGLYSSAGFEKVQRLPPGPDGGSRERWLLSAQKRTVTPSSAPSPYSGPAAGGYGCSSCSP
jgi:GNAT superfamily N-acetyltransferase